MSARYETLFRLGRGGMAEVFVGRLRGEGDFTKLVAIKRMLPHLAADEGLVRRFLDEARLAAHVRSAHVVSTLDVGRDPSGEPFIVLELVIGVTLARLLEAGVASLAERAHLVGEVALGLAEVHEARGPDGAPLRMVHRDVSPANVLVARDGRARLADFGIARADVPREATEAGQRLGKPGYISPEQVAGAPADARSDVWSLGVVLWEALAGRRLFAGGVVDPDREAPPLAWAAPGVPEALATVAAKALERDPASRYADARAFARALTEATAALPPSDPTQVAERVREAGGAALASLEEALREAQTEVPPSTRPLDLEEVTVSGMLGDGWDPGATTVLVEPATETRVEVAPAPARGRWPVIAIVAIGVAGLGLGLGLVMLLARGGEPAVVAPVEESVGDSDAASASEPASASASAPASAPASASAPAPEAAAGSGAEVEVGAGRRRRSMPRNEPSTAAPTRAGTVGVDVFDREGQ